MGIGIEWLRDYAESGTEYVTTYSDFMKELLSEYAALQAENERLKAERVDLEQFRKALDYAYDCGGSEVSHELYRELSELIDAYKGE